MLVDGAAAARAEVREATAAVLQRPLLRRASVRANVESGLRFRGVGRAERRRRGQVWLDRLGIGALADRPAHQLSGGEAQRVSLARAFAVGPRVLLLDEPFSALDAPTRGELLAELREALAATGTAALLVTHDRHEAAAVSDRVAILHDGELRQEGPAHQVLDHPADPDCARILGFDNVLPGRLLGSAAGEVAVPPGACRLTGAGLTVPARLVRTIPLGPVWRVILEAEGRTVLANAPEPPPAGLQPGDPVELRVDPSRDPGALGLWRWRTSPASSSRAGGQAAWARPRRRWNGTGRRCCAASPASSAARSAARSSWYARPGRSCRRCLRPSRSWRTRARAAGRFRASPPGSRRSRGAPRRPTSHRPTCRSSTPPSCAS